jgi:hypothetical protein
VSAPWWALCSVRPAEPWQLLLNRHISVFWPGSCDLLFCGNVGMLFCGNGWSQAKRFGNVRPRFQTNHAGSTTGSVHTLKHATFNTLLICTPSTRRAARSTSDCSLSGALARPKSAPQSVQGPGPIVSTSPTTAPRQYKVSQTSSQCGAILTCPRQVMLAGDLVDTPTVSARHCPQQSCFPVPNTFSSEVKSRVIHEPLWTGIKQRTVTRT